MEMRMFVAIDLPEKIKEEVQVLAHGLPGVRWTPPEQLHVTLHFLGNVDEHLVEDIDHVLSTVEAPPFSLHLNGIGQFLNQKISQILWVGVSADESLMQLKRSVDRALNGLGFAADRRRYQPHVTLARLKQVSRARVNHYIEAFGQFQTAPFQVREFTLYSSRLGPQGATHTVEGLYGLGRSSVAV